MMIFFSFLNVKYIVPLISPAYMNPLTIFILDLSGENDI